MFTDEILKIFNGLALEELASIDVISIDEKNRFFVQIFDEFV